MIILRESADLYGAWWPLDRINFAIRNGISIVLFGLTDQEIQQKRQWRRFGKFPSQKADVCSR